MPEQGRSTRPRKEWFCLECPVVAYGDAWHLQKKLVEARRKKILDRDTILILEHEPVFTLGRRGGDEYLKVPEGFLQKKGIPLFHIERGGTITYHGPGQLIVYPIVDLTRARLSVADYVTRLEEVMIRLSADWGVKARRDEKNRGVWVGRKKLGSLGVAIRRGISFHGLALNIGISLEPFTWMHPCGLEGIEVTSLEKQRKEPVPMAQIRQRVRNHVEDVFHVRLREVNMEELETRFPTKNKTAKQEAVF